MNNQKTESASKLAIVDTFTKLIFGQESQYSVSELGIIHALRVIDGDVSLDCHRHIGMYLRALGVQEMIGLVSKVSNGMAMGADLDGVNSATARQATRSLVLHH